jgi:hypothetical protein
VAGRICRQIRAEKPAFPPFSATENAPLTFPRSVQTVAHEPDRIPSLPADRPLLGIGLMLCFCVIVPFADALAKILGTDFPLMQLILVRFAAQAILLVPLALWLGRRSSPTARIVRLTALRAGLQMTGIALMFASLRYLPLADAVAIAFVMPFIMLLLGWFYLGEEVGPRRLGACAVGFIGTLMVVQPSFAEVGWPALLPLGVAVVFAFFMLVTRQDRAGNRPRGASGRNGDPGAARRAAPGVPSGRGDAAPCGVDHANWLEYNAFRLLGVTARSRISS